MTMFLTHTCWKTGVDGAAPVIIIHMAKYRGACSQADWSVSSHSQSAAVCSQQLSPALPCLAACLHRETRDLHLQYTNWKGAIREKEENHTCLCSIMYWALDQDRSYGGKEGGEACNIGINVHVCVCNSGGGCGDSLPLGELIQRICSASREGERGLIGTECATHLHWDTHTSQDFVSLTYRWVCEPPWSKIRAPITNSIGSSDWSWRMLSAHWTRVMSATRGLTACHLYFMQVCDCAWLCVYIKTIFYVNINAHMDMHKL